MTRPGSQGEVWVPDPTLEAGGEWIPVEACILPREPKRPTLLERVKRLFRRVSS